MGKAGVKIAEYLKKYGKKRRCEISRGLKMSPSTVSSAIPILIHNREIKKIEEKGKQPRYAHISYNPTEDQIIKIIECLEDCGCDEGFWDIEDWEEDKIEKELGDAFRTVTSKLLLDKYDPEVRKNFLEAVRRIAKKHS